MEHTQTLLTIKQDDCSIIPTLRYSQRAKHLQLRLSERGLEVVVPTKRKVSAKAITAFIEDHTDWILRHWPRWVGKTTADTPTVTLPNVIHLTAIDELWQIRYVKTSSTQLRLSVISQNYLQLTGPIDSVSTSLTRLRRWLKTRAQQVLSSQLKKLSLETGLAYQSLQIRNNRSRWGSCTHDKKISLCCKLLFLPPHLMRHIVLHELCHTEILKHNTRFWRLLTQHDSDTPLHRRLLRHANQQVPAWAR